VKIVILEGSKTGLVWRLVADLSSAVHGVKNLVKKGIIKKLVRFDRENLKKGIIKKVALPGVL
jgi:hypothetical protein